MAIIIPFLTNFGLQFSLVSLVLFLTYKFFQSKNQDVKLEMLEDEKQVIQKIKDNDDDEEVAPALPDDLEHVPFILRLRPTSQRRSVVLTSYILI